MATFESQIISLRIERDPRSVYAYAAEPANLAQWASGLGSALLRDGERWIVQTPAGPAGVRFSPPNEYGVLDHTVTLSSGAEIYVPLRVIANGAGSEIQLTLFRLPAMTDEQYAADAAQVRRDLTALKQLLETEAL
jgi:hypothetical protein